MVVKPTVLPASAQPHKPTRNQRLGRNGRLDGEHDRDGLSQGEPGPTLRMPGLEDPTGSVRGLDGQQEAEFQGTDQMAPTVTRGIRANGARRLSSDPNTPLAGRPAPTRGPNGRREVERPEGQREAELQGADQMASTAAQNTQADGAAARTAARLSQLQQKKCADGHTE